MTACIHDHQGGVRMPSRVLVSGKHPVSVRVSEEDYKKLSAVAMVDGMTVNEWIVAAALDALSCRDVEVIEKK